MSVMTSSQYASSMVCDANSALRPEELTATIGRKIAIALPDGIPGARVV